MLFDNLFKCLILIVVVCLFTVGAVVVSEWVVGDTNDSKSSVTTDNDGQIAGRYHRRNSTARFFRRG